MNKRYHIYKRVAIRSILLIQATGFFYDNISYGWSYPLKEIAKPTCKAQHWKELSSDCKMALPIIAKANYTAYKDNQMMRLVYSVLWGAPYSDGWDMTKGAHEGVDITSAEGTPVYAIGDGEVVKARDAVGYGKLVTIKHILPNKSVVYSIYGHLESYIVKEGTIIKEGQQIGTMGHEGMASGNHLHIAINTTPDNTYAFRGCLNYPKTTDYDIVENGLCRSSLFARTVDPIAFIEYNGIIPVNLTSSSIINRNVTKPIIPVKNNTTTNNTSKNNTTTTTKPTTNTPTNTTTNTTNTPKTTTPVVPVGNTVSSKNLTSSDNFLKKYTITVTSNFGTTLKKGGSSTIGITIKDANGKTFAGILDKEISITPSKQNVLLSPRIIRYISEGQVVLIIEAKDVGSSDLVVSYGNTVIGKLTVKVQ